MEANLVVDLLHKFLQVLPQFRETAVAAGVDFFSLQGFQEALTLAVFPRTGRPAHAQAGTATLQPLHVIVARILRSAIGVMHQPRLRFSAGNRGFQRGSRQAGFQGSPQLPADHFARVGVQHHRQKYELTTQPDVRNVRYPQLVDPAQLQRLRQVRVYLETVIGVGRHHELATAHRQQIVVSHGAPYLLLAHYKPGTLQQRCDPPISISPIGQRRSLHRVPQCRLCFSRRLLLPVPIETRPAPPCQFTHPLDTHLALRLPAADLVVDGIPPGFSLCRRNPSTFRKALLKKLASRLRRPSSPSRPATWASSCWIFRACSSGAPATEPFPYARSPSALRFHRYNAPRLTPNSAANRS